MRPCFIVMSIFNRTKDITLNDAINITRTTENTVLVDIRTKEKYKKDHIPGSINVPFNNIKTIHSRIPDTDTRLYIYGDEYTRPLKYARSFRKEGYHNIVSAGRIEDHHVREYR